MPMVGCTVVSDAPASNVMTSTKCLPDENCLQNPKRRREVTRSQIPLSDPQLANAGTGKAATCASGPAGAAGASCSGASNGFTSSEPFPGYHPEASS